MSLYSRQQFGQKYAAIDISAASGDQTVVSAVSGKSIRVHSMEFVTDTATSITTKSGSNTISGAQAFAVNGGKVLPLNEAGWFETNKGEALILNSSNSATIGGSLVYSEV